MNIIYDTGKLINDPINLDKVDYFYKSSSHPTISFMIGTKINDWYFKDEKERDLYYDQILIQSNAININNFINTVKL